MRSRVVLVLVTLLVAGCGGERQQTDPVPGASALATTTRVPSAETVLAATVDATGAPVVVTDDGGLAPVLHRGADPSTWSRVQLIGISPVQSIWAIGVAPDASVVMVADGHTGPEIVRVDAAGLLTRHAVDVDLGAASTTRRYSSRNPMRTYAAITTDGSTAVLLTVPIQPGAALGELGEPTGQVELHRVDTGTGRRTAHTTTQLPGPGPFDVLGIALSPDGLLTSVAALLGPEGGKPGKLDDATSLDEVLVRFDAALQPVDQVRLAGQVSPGGGQPLAIDGDGTTYALVSGIEGDGHSGTDLVSVARGATEPTVVDGLDGGQDADALAVDVSGEFAYLPGWASPTELGVTVVDLRAGSITGRVRLCKRGTLGIRTALSPDGKNLLLAGVCATAEEAESQDQQPTSLLVLR